MNGTLIAKRYRGTVPENYNSINTGRSAEWEQYRLLPPGRCIFRADAHVKSGRVILPLILRRICRYDCWGK